MKSTSSNSFSPSYFAFCPELQGSYTQGTSYEEALENIKGPIRLHVEDRIEVAEGTPRAHHNREAARFRPVLTRA